MGFSSTIVTYGRGKGIVVGTGHRTEIGNIATKIQSYDEEQTPLQIKLNQLGKVLGTLTIIICVVVFGVGILQGREVLEMLLTSISLAVAAIPEGLPAIVTIVLSIGMNRMAGRNAIVKKLLAVETLGATSVICSDKTGTLTQNAMTVRQIFTDGNHYEVTGSGYDIKGSILLNQQPLDINKNKALQQCLTIGVLCNNSILKQNTIAITGVWRNKTETGWCIEGDPTEGAIIVAAGKAAENVFWTSGIGADL